MKTGPRHSLSDDPLRDTCLSFRVKSSIGLVIWLGLSLSSDVAVRSSVTFSKRTRFFIEIEDDSERDESRQRESHETSLNFNAILGNKKFLLNRNNKQKVRVINSIFLSKHFPLVKKEFSHSKSSFPLIRHSVLVVIVLVVFGAARCLVFFAILALVLSLRYVG